MPVSTMPALSKEEEEMFLEKLEEFTLVEERIVTYKWLSKALNIHINLAKGLLNTFYTNEKRKGSICATFVLAGRLQKNGNYHVTVVGEDKVEKVKSLFGPLSSEHVYSVQQTQNPPSWSILYTADSQPTDSTSDMTKLAAIRCGESVQRAAEEMAKLRLCVQPAQPTVLKKSATNIPSSKAEEKKSPIKNEETKVVQAIQTEVKNKGSIAAMFAAQSSKTVSSKAPISGSSTKGIGKGSKKGGGISCFFNKVSKEDADKNKEVENADHTEKQTPNIKRNQEGDQRKPVCSNSPTPKTEESESKKAKSEPDSNIQHATKQEKKPKKKGKGKGKQKQETKKRKRIVVMDSESSDDDIFGGDDEEDSRGPSPEPSVLEAKALESEDEDVIPSTNESTMGRNRRRRKVIKDKTYTDEEGYIVTEKVTEYESCSGSDSEIINNSKKAKETKATCETDGNKQTYAKVKAEEMKAVPKRKSPEKVKQQSLMSFFKRKEN